MGSQGWAVLGVPVDSVAAPAGGPPFGTELSPAVLRDLGLVGRLAGTDAGDLDVRITGPDRDVVSGIVGWPSVGSVVAATRAAVTGLLADGRRPLLLVGFAALPIRALAFAWTTDPVALIAAQVLDGVSGTMLGVLTALTIADLTAGTGRFNLAQGFVGTISGIGASLSTTLSGLVAGSLGRAAGFLGIAAVALVALLLLWLLMPETHPSK